MKKRGPWKIKKSKIFYKNPWVTLREDKVMNSKGKIGFFGVTIINPGVTIVPVDKQGNVYLTREFHYALGKTGIEAASGAIEKKESKLSAAKRELREETGVTAKKWTFLGRVDPFTNLVYCPAYLYLARDIKQGTQKQDELEKIKVVKIPFRKAVRLVEQGKIVHTPTCLAILKAQKYIR